MFTLRSTVVAALATGVMLAVPTIAVGQSSLPQCPSNTSFALWTNCQGTHTDADGRKYVGEFKDGKYNGQGTRTFASGSKYVGEWKYGELNGQGTFTFSDGDKYVGDFKDGQLNLNP
jgi:hypothetical protein